MFYLILFLSVFLVGILQPIAYEYYPDHPAWQIIPNDTCGQRPVSAVATRIVGGSDAKKNAVPWIAKLYADTTSDQRVLICGGSIISSKYVLSSAECCRSVLAGNSGGVGLGDNDYNTYLKTIGINQMVIPENATNNPSNNVTGNDICVIQLKENIEFGDSIQPICLPDRALLRLPSHAKLRVAGWGVIDDATKAKPSTLQTGFGRLLGKSVCRNFHLDEKFFCFIGNSSCHGDAGGPVYGVRSAADASVKRNYLFGVMVAGEDGCQRISIATNVSAHLHWILDTIKTID